MTTKHLPGISGIEGPSLGHVLREELVAGKPAALGVASAFVSIGGLRDLLAITRKCKGLECRLLAGISNAITHPQALTEALTAGWKVRLAAVSGRRLFHPKLILSGRSFLRDGTVKEPSFVYVGSSNLTHGGLYNNIECGVIARADIVPPGVAACFATLWDTGKRATQSRLEAYAKEFASRNRERSVRDIEDLGVSDDAEDNESRYVDLRRKRVLVSREVIPTSAAAAAWTGLESFTGEYRFQVEFPRAAGVVLNRVIRSAASQHVNILCPDDGAVREMSYRYYTDNGMFRLNIPDDTPGVKRARSHHNGIVLVEVSNRDDAAAKLTIIPPGNRLEAVVRRSVLLGTWGSTSTRTYGWY